MKKTNCLFTLWVAALCAGTHVYAVGMAPAILSNYGEIQSVKNYSSNPFWNKNSPYNQNFPKPIYATGADLNTGDCNRVVENLVTSYCAEHNYCRNLRISDVRPTIMVQLSQLPGHNFATSCGGYIDSAFTKFQKEYGNVSTVNLPKPASQPTNIEITNPFAQKQTAAQKAIADRTAELERLQSITTPTAGVHAEYFPKTTADLSFTDRIANTAAGYEPYKDKPSYKKPDFLGEDEEFFNRLRAQNFEKFCERRPADPDCVKLYCEQHPDDEKCKKTTPTQQTDPNPVVNPPATGCPEIADHRDPKTCKCYPSDFMDSDDCNCRGLSKWDATKKKCVCPITDTSNLSIDEWAYVTTMCKCPSIKPIYNSTTHKCDAANYTLLQCRLHSPDKIKNIGDKIDNKSGAQRYLYDCENAINNHDILDHCFTPCKKNPSEKGYVNAVFEKAINNGDFPAFCTGREGDMPINFFMDANKFDSESTPLQLSHDQAFAIVKGFRDFNGPETKWTPGPRISDKCNDTKPRVWVLYVLKNLGNKEYEIVDREVFSHSDLLP